MEISFFSSRSGSLFASESSAEQLVDAQVDRQPPLEPMETQRDGAIAVLLC